MLKYYDGSPSALVMSLLPDHPWDLHQFQQLPQNYWSAESNRKDFMNTLEKNLNISEWRDWYRVTKRDILEAGTFVSLLEAKFN